MAVGRAATWAFDAWREAVRGGHGGLHGRDLHRLDVVGVVGTEPEGEELPGRVLPLLVTRLEGDHAVGLVGRIQAGGGGVGDREPADPLVDLGGGVLGLQLALEGRDVEDHAGLALPQRVGLAGEGAGPVVLLREPGVEQLLLVLLDRSDDDRVGPLLLVLVQVRPPLLVEVGELHLHLPLQGPLVAAGLVEGGRVSVVDDLVAEGEELVVRLREVLLGDARLLEDVLVVVDAEHRGAGDDRRVPLAVDDAERLLGVAELGDPLLAVEGEEVLPWLDEGERGDGRLPEHQVGAVAGGQLRRHVRLVGVRHRLGLDLGAGGLLEGVDDLLGRGHRVLRGPHGQLHAVEPGGGVDGRLLGVRVRARGPRRGIAARGGGQAEGTYEGQRRESLCLHRGLSRTGWSRAGQDAEQLCADGVFDRGVGGV